MITTPQQATAERPAAVVSVADRTSYTGGLRVARVVLQVATHRGMELVDLTDAVSAAVSEYGLRTGWVDVSCRHTSCGLVVNENETGLRNDLCTLGSELVVGHPNRLWCHDDLSIRTENLVDGERPNAHSHLLTMMFTSPALTIWVEDSALDLGRWQRLMLAEFDGPRPDLDTPAGGVPVHPIRQVVLNLCTAETQAPDGHRNGDRNGHLDGQPPR